MKRFKDLTPAQLRDELLKKSLFFWATLTAVAVLGGLLDAVPLIGGLFALVGLVAGLVALPLSLLVLAFGLVFLIEKVLMPSWEALRHGSAGDYDSGPMDRYEFSLLLLVGSLMAFAVSVLALNGFEAIDTFGTLFASTMLIMVPLIMFGTFLYGLFYALAASVVSAVEKIRNSERKSIGSAISGASSAVAEKSRRFAGYTRRQVEESAELARALSSNKRSIDL